MQRVPKRLWSVSMTWISRPLCLLCRPFGNAVQGRSTDLREERLDIRDRDGWVGQHVGDLRFLLRVQLLRPAALPPPRPGGLEPSLGALPDQRAFTLSQGAEDVKDEFPRGGGRVKALVQHTEADATLPQPGDEVDEIAEGTSQPIEFLDDKYVPVTHEGQGLGEAWAF
jgi:hypothetical protein